MNKVSLLTLGKKLSDGNLYKLSIHDLEPSGVIVHAYDQINSTEYTLPVSEFEFAKCGYSRQQDSLAELINTIEIVAQGSRFVLQSTNDGISKIKKPVSGEDVAAIVSRPLNETGPSLNEVLVQGMVELCKVKPVGNDAVRWLGEWLLANNPNKPNVVDPDE